MVLAGLDDHSLIMIIESAAFDDFGRFLRNVHKSLRLFVTRLLLLWSP